MNPALFDQIRRVGGVQHDDVDLAVVDCFDVVGGVEVNAQFNIATRRRGQVRLKLFPGNGLHLQVGVLAVGDDQCFGLEQLGGIGWGIGQESTAFVDVSRSQLLANRRRSRPGS